MHKTEANSIKAFWYRSANVGDVLTPLILSAIAGKPVAWTDAPGKWLCAGSILHCAEPGDTLFGIGSFEAMPQHWHAQGLRILAVRGPATAKLAGWDGTVFGDAGLLLPRVLPATPAPMYDWGIVAHYADPVTGPLPACARVIPVSLPPAMFVAALMTCKTVISSSLHGIVLAEAYGIPAIRATMGRAWDAIRAFDHKHADYYEGTGRSLPPALTLARALDTAGIAPILDRQIDSLYKTAQAAMKG